MKIKIKIIAWAMVGTRIGRVIKMVGMRRNPVINNYLEKRRSDPIHGRNKMLEGGEQISCQVRCEGKRMGQTLTTIAKSLDCPSDVHVDAKGSTFRRM